MKSYNIKHFEIGFFHTAWFLWHPIKFVFINSSFLYITEYTYISSYWYTTVCLTIHSLKDIWADSSFWVLGTKLLRPFMYGYRFCLNEIFHFSELNGQECNCWIIRSLHVEFCKNCQTIFQSSCTILHSHMQCIGDPVSLHPLQYLVLFLWVTLIGK